LKLYLGVPAAIPQKTRTRQTSAIAARFIEY
jgi:hypothetical protein